MSLVTPLETGPKPNYDDMGGNNSLSSFCIRDLCAAMVIAGAITEEQSDLTISQVNFWYNYPDGI